MAARKQIPAAHCVESLRRVRSHEIQTLSKVRIGLDAVLARSHPGGESRAIHFGRADVNGVMPTEECPTGRQRIEIWAVLWTDKVRPHPVPHKDHDMFRSSIRLGFGPAARKQENERNQEGGEKLWHFEVNLRRRNAGKQKGTLPLLPE